MENPRPHGQNDVFLGTADIIHRVELAQGAPMTRWLHRARGYGLGLMVALVSVGLVLMWRHGAANYPAATQAVDAPVQAADAVEVAEPHAAEIAPPGEAAPSHGAVQPLQITFSHHTEHFWLDGHKRTASHRGWLGHVPLGNHHVAVQSGGHMLRHTFAVVPGGVHVLVDPAHHTFVVKAATGGHRASRAP